MQLHHKKKRVSFRPYFFAVAGGVVLLWASFWVPYLRISHIQTNDALADNAEIQRAVATVLTAKNKLFLPKNNVLLFSTKDAEQALRVEGIGLARVTKRYPNTIFVEFENTEPKFIFCPDTFCYYVNQNGIISEKAPLFSENPLPLLMAEKKDVVLGDQIIQKQTANFLTIFLRAIIPLQMTAETIFAKEEIGNTALSIVLHPNEQDNISWRLDISPALSPEKAAQDLQLLLREKIKDNIKNLEYIDMRFPDKAFYKLIQS